VFLFRIISKVCDFKIKFTVLDKCHPYGFFSTIFCLICYCIIKHCPVEQGESKVNFYVRKITKIITEQLGQEGTSGEHLVQRSAQSRVSQNRLLRAASSQVFSISKDGESATSLGNPFQCLTTLIVKEVFSYV